MTDARATTDAQTAGAPGAEGPARGSRARAAAVLGHGFWRRRHGGDPAVVGETIRLGDHPFEIIGVAREGFLGVTVGVAHDLFVPLCAVATVRDSGSILDARSTWSFRVLARLPDGVGLEEARARLDALAPGRLIQSLLFGIEPTSPAAMLLPMAFLLLVGPGSGFFPVCRATRVDPVQLLRGR